MYEKIIRAKLTFPPYLSANAKSFLAALLERSPKQRLGGADNDATDVKKHPFFEGLDWAKLMKRELTPPFKPTVTEGPLDTTNIDDEFKQETPRDSPVMPSTLQSKVNFPNFTYSQENRLNQHHSSV